METLNGKVALVTGGAGGIGKAIARLFKANGAEVVLTDINGDAVSRFADEIGCASFTHDVAVEEQWVTTVHSIEQRFGKLDILINNAGIMGNLAHGSPEDTDLSDFLRVQTVNLGGPFLGCKTAIPALRRAGGGAIVNISSIAAVKGTWFETAYGVSKAGVKQLTLSVAQHCAKENIRCNAILPGQIETGMSEGAYATLATRLGAPSADAMREMLLGYVPMGRLGSAEDIADAALYLASSQSKYVTGASLLVDGGMGVT